MICEDAVSVERKICSHRSWTSVHMPHFVAKHPHLNSSILVVAQHSAQHRRDGVTKFGEYGTASLVHELAVGAGVHGIYIDRPIDYDPNRWSESPLRLKITKIIENYEIKLLFDIHALRPSRKTDVDIGYQNGHSLSNFRQLPDSIETAMRNIGMKNISCNQFPGMHGDSLLTSARLKKVDAVQLEINSSWLFQLDCSPRQKEKADSVATALKNVIKNIAG